MLLRTSFNFVVVDNVTKNCDGLIEVWSGSGHTETNSNFDLNIWNKVYTNNWQRSLQSVCPVQQLIALVCFSCFFESKRSIESIYVKKQHIQIEVMWN